jgi:flagellar biosynthetic protein FliR
MVDVFGLTAAQFETFLLIVIRVVSMLEIFPIFSAAQIPQQVRIGLSFIIGFLIYKTIPIMPVSHGLGDLAIAVGSQVILGLIVGFVASLVFVGIQFAGEVLDLQIGFAVANIINPQTQQTITVIGEFELTLATLLFLVSDSHLLLLQGIVGSFHLVPLPYVKLDPSIAGNIVIFLSQAMLIVFRIAAPASIALFLVNVCLAFMARVAPQMNVFVVGFPLQVGVGLVMVAFCVPILGSVAPQIYSDVAREMDIVMRAMRAT